MDALEALIHNRVTDDAAARMLLESGYSSDIESAKRTVILIHNDISSFRMFRNKGTQR